MSSVITLTTDFGISDAYVASVKGVVLSINSEAVITDICHSVEPQNILQAAFILSMAHHYFPAGTIHVVIVDPGVGSHRKAILLKTPSAFFLAPDNGVLSYILDELCPASVASPASDSCLLGQVQLRGDLEAVVITNPDFWRQPVSTTFHGRDIFAPVAAHLSMGVPVCQFGEPVDCVYTFSLLQPYYDSKGDLIGRVLHRDSFGNLITNIKEGDLSGEDVNVEISDHFIHRISRYYAETEGLAAIIGSSGYLEVSLGGGNAADFLRVKVGDKLKVITGRDKLPL